MSQRDIGGGRRRKRYAGSRKAGNGVGKKEVRGDNVDVGVHICVAHRPSSAISNDVDVQI